MNDLVSIVMPSYNAARFIDEAIESVKRQTYLSWELIIVDDASTDTSRKIISNYAAKDRRILLINNVVNIGVAYSRNKALEKALGRYVAFLDSDDVWVPEKLELQIQFMENYGVLFSYSSYYIIDSAGSRKGQRIVKEQVSYQDLLKTSSIGTLTTIYDASIVGKVFFNKIGHEDYAMKLSLLKKTHVAKGLKQPLASYRLTDGSLSRNKLKAIKWQWHIYRKVEKLGFVKSLRLFLFYACHGICKNC